MGTGLWVGCLPTKATVTTAPNLQIDEFIFIPAD